MGSDEKNVRAALQLTSIIKSACSTHSPCAAHALHSVWRSAQRTVHAPHDVGHAFITVLAFESHSPWLTHFAQLGEVSSHFF